MIFLGEWHPVRIRVDFVAFSRLPVLVGLGMCFEGLAILGPLILCAV